MDETTGIVGVRLDVINQRELTVARLAAEVLWRRGDAASDGRGSGSEPVARTADEATRTAREAPFELAGLPI